MLLLTNKDFREFVELLNSNGVRFLIVGGHAVALHGYPRFTGDLDVWVATDPENAARVAKVLTDFGFAGLKLTAKDFARPGYAIQLGRPPYRIDLLTSIDAVTFSSAYCRRRTVRVGALRIPFIGLEDLLANKRATGRPQDLADVEKLSSAVKGRSIKTPPLARKRGRRKQCAV
jgi:predicted nucleotidyltransferase